MITDLTVGLGDFVRPLNGDHSLHQDVFMWTQKVTFELGIVSSLLNAGTYPTTHTACPAPHSAQCPVPTDRLALCASQARSS